MSNADFNGLWPCSSSSGDFALVLSDEFTYFLRNLLRFDFHRPSITTFAKSNKYRLYALDTELPELAIFGYGLATGFEFIQKKAPHGISPCGAFFLSTFSIRY